MFSENIIIKYNNSFQNKIEIVCKLLVYIPASYCLNPSMLLESVYKNYQKLYVIEFFLHDLPQKGSQQSRKSISRKNIAELELVWHFPKYAGNSFNQIYIIIS